MGKWKEWKGREESVERGTIGSVAARSMEAM